MGDSGSDPFCPHSPDGRLGKVRKSDIGGRLHGAKGINRANLLHPGGLRVVQRYTQALRHRLVMVVSGPADLLKTQGIEPQVPLRRPQGVTAEIGSDFSASFKAIRHQNAFRSGDSHRQRADGSWLVND